VRVHDSIRHVVSPPPPALDTAPLAVHRAASLDVEVPALATDGAPVTLVFTGVASSACFGLDPPAVEGRTITAQFEDNCPILPPGGPNVFREEYEVGPLAAGSYEILFFDRSNFLQPALAKRPLTVVHGDGCVPSPTRLCLAERRFEVSVAWEDFRHNTGEGRALPLAGEGDSGLFWFFLPDNVELTVKVLDGCTVNGHHWVFLSSGSTVRYVVTVRDTLTGEVRTYLNELREEAPLEADTRAFPCAVP
jgi:hypothetical protein